ncbi:hypothetical protein [Novosphingobium sp.]|nr:hypothetical protein [Novosphingobium sp.]
MSRPALQAIALVWGMMLFAALVILILHWRSDTPRFDRRVDTVPTSRL